MAPIHDFAYLGNLAQVRLLLQLGAQVEEKDHCSSTPLICASLNSCLEVVKYLVKEARANVEAQNRGGRTPLMNASWNGSLAVVKYLVEEAGANVEARDTDGKTALDLARQGNRTAVVQYLKQQQMQPTFPSLPSEPQFTSNRRQFASALEQWVQNVESVLSSYLTKFDQWKERQNQSCQSQLRALDEEIAEIERKKADIQQKNTEAVSQASQNAQVSARQCKRKIADTREIIGNLRGDRRPTASAPSADKYDESPPVSLCCPITLQLMTDPVILEDGHTYEQSAILKHWRTQEGYGLPVTSPQTNQRISSKQLIPNVLVRSQCHEWRAQLPSWSS